VLGDEDSNSTTAPCPIEQPTTIITKPLSEKDQDDRVRMASADPRRPLPTSPEPSGLPPLPGGELKFPFKAKSVADGTPLTVTAA